MSQTTVPEHPLAPDLAAIAEFAKLDTHDVREEARAALALYGDVCWRMAIATLPVRTTGAIAAIEAEIALQLRRYMAGEVEPAAFWIAFADGVTRLDATFAGGLEAERHAEAGLAALRALKERVAAAKLPPTLRQHAQGVLNLLGAEIGALLDGKLALEAFDPLFAQGEAAVAATIAREAEAERQEAAFHAMIERALATAPPAFLEAAIARQVHDLTLAWEAGDALDPAKLADLNAEVGQACRFQATHDRADGQYRALRDIVARWTLPEVPAEAAARGLAELEALMANFEVGEMTPEAFDERFAATSRAVEACLLGNDGNTSLARRRVDEFHERLADATLPTFVAATAHLLFNELAALAPGPDDAGVADEVAFLAAAVRLEACLAFGADVAREEDAALGQYRALAARARGGAHVPLLVGPIDDALAGLRRLLQGLHAGGCEVADFHADFAGARQRLEVLLAWQALIADVRPEVHPPTPR